MKKKIIFTLLFGCILYGCSQSLYVPSSPDASKQQALLAGRQLYVDHCSGCHNLHFPKELTADVWKKELDEMAVKAKISGEEKGLIYQYLTSQP